MLKAFIACTLLMAYATGLPMGFFPYGTLDDVTDWSSTFPSYGGSYGPYSRFGSWFVNMMDGVMDDESVWPMTTDIWSNTDTMIPEIMDFWKNPMLQSSTSNMFSDYGIGNKPWLSSSLTTGVSPYSRSNMFNVMVKAMSNSPGRLFANKLMAHMGLLTHKLHQECPEMDGGLSYMTCLNDARTVAIDCFKTIEDHPKFMQCKHHPIVRRALRDSFIIEAEWHKQMLTCLTKPSITDNIVSDPMMVNSHPLLTDVIGDFKSVEDIVGVPLSPLVTGYNVDVVNTKRQCVWKLRTKLNKCDLVNMRCPKFQKCYMQPMIKSLNIKRRFIHERLSTVVDQCLQQGIMTHPFGGIMTPPSMGSPFSNIPF